MLEYQLPPVRSDKTLKILHYTSYIYIYIYKESHITLCLILSCLTVGTRQYYNWIESVVIYMYNMTSIVALFYSIVVCDKYSKLNLILLLSIHIATNEFN